MRGETVPPEPVNAPPRKAVAPASLTAIAASIICSRLSTEHGPAITTGFAGTNVLLFGAVDGQGDVVVVVRGPDRPVTIHRKSRVLGIWANTAQMTFERAPSFYAVASSRPLNEIAPATVLSS